MKQIRRTQSCKFMFQDDLDHAFLFRVTFNTPEGPALDMVGVRQLTIEKLIDVQGSSDGVTMFLLNTSLVIVADWLCSALFDSYHRGVTVELWAEHLEEGATATYGEITVVEAVDGEANEDGR